MRTKGLFVLVFFLMLACSVTSHADERVREAFIDSHFAAKMKQLHIPGLAFVLVQDGEFLIRKGYGLADIERKVRVDPNRTLFRPASIGKLFTVTAVMQLVEKGALHPEDDVNKYLTDFKIEETFDAPVRLKHLLTHTGGFDDRLLGEYVWTAGEIVPLSQHLKSHMPPRVMSPGVAMSYSNHGIALAGLIVEKVSGIPFEQYVDEKILQPLGMHRKRSVRGSLMGRTSRPTLRRSTFPARRCLSALSGRLRN